MRSFLAAVIFTAISGVVGQSSLAGDATSFILHLGNGSQYHNLNEHALYLNSGDLLIEATESGLVVTPMAFTYVKDGAIVLFRVNAGIERIMTMWDKSRSSVVTIAQKSAATLGAGDEVIITDHRPFYREIHQSDVIARRRIDRYFVGNGVFMTTTEFSLPHALRHSGLLTSGNASDKNLSHKILKTALILDSLRGDREPFAVGLPINQKQFNPADPLSSFEDLLPTIKDHSPRLAPLPATE